MTHLIKTTIIATLLNTSAIAQPLTPLCAVGPNIACGSDGIPSSNLVVPDLPTEGSLLYRLPSGAWTAIKPGEKGQVLCSKKDGSYIWIFPDDIERTCNK